MTGGIVEAMNQTSLSVRIGVGIVTHDEACEKAWENNSSNLLDRSGSNVASTTWAAEESFGLMGVKALPHTWAPPGWTG
jgi:hypothetical protein